MSSHIEELSRKQSVKMATDLADLEQKQRVERNEEDASWDKAERTANQRRASKMLDAEQSRRVAEAAASDANAQKEREENQKKAIDLMEAERERRSSLSMQADVAAEDILRRNDDTLARETPLDALALKDVHPIAVLACPADDMTNPTRLESVKNCVAAGYGIVILADHIGGDDNIDLRVLEPILDPTVNRFS
ncbi:hypothetical protein TrRE_jg7419 [Triparma retinervis]|uniref:Uncharacterized protein n=1 Tax=Triparma retinervis TaxID=2557542 RepID=A0A9W7ADA2_9STRA|nr:hypothetical protein TrRE_jg7419 [Triparma retinervis]